MEDEPDPLTIQRGLIVAPAGCGKTHAIVSALRNHSGTKPILVLTHTNAGVAALRRRLATFHVPRSAYRLATIDGWAMRLIATFPMRSGRTDGTTPRRPDYPQIRQMARSAKWPQASFAADTSHESLSPPMTGSS